MAFFYVCLLGNHHESSIFKNIHRQEITWQWSYSLPLNHPQQEALPCIAKE
jgi:hypothetical protein